MSKLEMNIENKNINTTIKNEYLNSVNEFQKSIENATGEKIDLEKEKNKYFEFNLDNIEKNLEEYQLQDILKIEKKQNSTIYSIKINVNNYENLKGILPIIQNEKVRVYLARYNLDETEEEYLDIIDYVFGEEAKEDLKKSQVKIRITSDNTFIKAESCQIKNNEIFIEFRLLDFLLLKNEISFSFETRN